MMNTLQKSLLVLFIGGVALAGTAGNADARWGGHGYQYGGCGPGGGWREISPEMRRMMEKAYDDIAPLQLELRAKQDELTARIYGGADDKSIRELADAVSRLQSRLGEARVDMQKQFAKAGVPLRSGRGCPGGFGPMHGGTHGHRGWQDNTGSDGGYGAPLPSGGDARSK
jgi:Spy/CpxP family protein refolding chaperone